MSSCIELPWSLVSPCVCRVSERLSLTIGGSPKLYMYDETPPHPGPRAVRTLKRLEANLKLSDEQSSIPNRLGRRERTILRPSWPNPPVNRQIPRARHRHGRDQCRVLDTTSYAVSTPDLRSCFASHHFYFIFKCTLQFCLPPWPSPILTATLIKRADDFINPTAAGGSFLDKSAGLGEPLNVIISSKTPLKSSRLMDSCNMPKRSDSILSAWGSTLEPPRLLI
ncbi:hypothetical protein B0H17DRAFT_502182 [Mycena rosella]|uniref:Uncharacterized protein n=1 Tax=Mycena rosella TaxID=1033263 RepID=A0AAD7DJU5_MYCRO|nr:hypothetical protein B0H17DRAFT_502182 [Mycena rosella]